MWVKELNIQLFGFMLVTDIIKGGFYENRLKKYLSNNAIREIL